MGVGIDKAWQDNSPLYIHDLGVTGAFLDLFARANGRNQLIADQHSAVLDYAEF